MRLHRGLLVAWLVITVAATATGLLSSVAFVAACSLYANVAAHWSALNAAKSEMEASDNGGSK